MAVTSLVMLTAFAAVYLTTYNNINADNQKKLDSLTDSLIITEVSNINPSVSPELHGNAYLQRDEISHSVSDSPAVGRMTSDSSPSFVVTVDNDGSITGISSTLSADTAEDFYVRAVDVAWNRNDNSTVTISERHWIYKISPVRVIRIENGRQSRVEVSENRFQIAFFEVTDSRKTLQDLLFTIILVSTGLMAVIFMISYIFANRAIKPISESWEKQRKFVADASHELKTPLGTIMANYDVLTANGDETIKSQSEWFGYIKIGIDRMNKLISNLLTLARSENTGIQGQKLPFDIDDLLCGVMRSMEAAVRAKICELIKQLNLREILSATKNESDRFSRFYMTTR
jgi:signal transduction histidine kinase